MAQILPRYVYTRLTSFLYIQDKLILIFSRKLQSLSCPYVIWELLQEPYVDAVA